MRSLRSRLSPSLLRYSPDIDDDKPRGSTLSASGWMLRTLEERHKLGSVLRVSRVADARTVVLRFQLEDSFSNYVTRLYRILESADRGDLLIAEGLFSPCVFQLQPSFGGVMRSD
jgi:hypothetical protein